VPCCSSGSSPDCSLLQLHTYLGSFSHVRCEAVLAVFFPHRHVTVKYRPTVPGIPAPGGCMAGRIPANTNGT
jgi:hypothetical protein